VAAAAPRLPSRGLECRGDPVIGAARRHHPVPERAPRAIAIRERVGQRRVDLLPPPERGRFIHRRAHELMSKRERVAADLDHPDVLRRIEGVGRKRELRGGPVNHPQLAGVIEIRLALHSGHPEDRQLVGALGRIQQQRTLARPCLAAQDECAAVALQGAVEKAIDYLALAVATNEPSGGPLPRTAHLVAYMIAHSAAPAKQRAKLAASS
jgi:hypothetical protein